MMIELNMRMGDKAEIVTSETRKCNVNGEVANIIWRLHYSRKRMRFSKNQLANFSECARSTCLCLCLLYVLLLSNCK